MLKQIIILSIILISSNVFYGKLSEVEKQELRELHEKNIKETNEEIGHLEELKESIEPLGCFWDITVRYKKAPEIVKAIIHFFDFQRSEPEEEIVCDSFEGLKRKTLEYISYELRKCDKQNEVSEFALGLLEHR